MTKHNTESVYDVQMYPLVAKLIEIAKEHKIPLFVSAGMLCDVDGEPTATTCTTLITHGVECPKGLAGMDNRHNLCFEIVRGHGGFDTACAMIITRHHATKDGT